MSKYKEGVRALCPAYDDNVPTMHRTTPHFKTNKPFGNADWCKHYHLHSVGFGACKGQLHHLENSITLQVSQRLFFWAGCGLQPANWTALPFYFRLVQRISQILLEYNTILTKARREGIILCPRLNTSVVCVDDHHIKHIQISSSAIVKGKLCLFCSQVF